MAMMIKNDQVIGGGVSKAEELAVIDTNGILGTAGAATDTQTLLDGVVDLAAGNKANIGDLAALDTSAKGSAVLAINELAAKGGDMLTGTLTALGWSSNTQTVNVSGMTATLNGVVGMLNTATAAQISAASSAGIRATAQGAGTVTFVCDSTPSVDIPFGVYVYK